jgi:hypothetical protein
MSLGLCTTPEFPLSKTEESELNPPYYRSLLYQLSDINTLLSWNRPFVITLNNQCKEVGGDWSGWDNTVHLLLEHLKSRKRLKDLLLLGCGNEFDIYWTENKSVPPEFAADLARRTARLAHNYNVKVAPTSVAGPQWVHYLSIMADLCRDDVDYFDIHPYGQRPEGWKDGQRWLHGDLKDVVNTVKTIGQKPVVFTEYGVKVRDAGNEKEVANFLYAVNNSIQTLDVSYCAWFAYCDEIGAPHERGPDAFGLKSDKGVKRPAYITYAQIHASSVPTPIPEPPPPPLQQWRGQVGDGLLAMMLEDYTEPAQRKSTWLPLGVTPSDVEECYGKNGVCYVWLLGENKGFRFFPT